MSSSGSPFDVAELERVVEQLARRVDRVAAELGEELEPYVSAPVPVDLVDRGEAFVLTADLPGVAVGDVDLRVAGRRVHLEATAGEDSAAPAEGADEDGAVETAGAGEPGGDGDGNGPTYLRRERRRRTVSRAITLPEPVDEAAVEAGYRNGVLTVTLPKRDEADGTAIEIE